MNLSNAHGTNTTQKDEPMETHAQLIVIDPPWNECGGGKIKRGADRHYPLIKSRDLPAVIKSATFNDGSRVWNPDPAGCHVWLWTTNTFLPDAFELLQALGARYITNMAWAKCRPVHHYTQTMLQACHDAGNAHDAMLAEWERDLNAGMYCPEPFGIGQYLRGAHELALLGIIGKRTTQCRNVPSLLLAPRGKHSQKPDEMFQRVARIAGIQPHERAVEMFARGQREGWLVWGNET